MGVGGGDLRAIVRSPVIRPCPLASTPLDQIINTIPSRPLADHPAKVDAFQCSVSINVCIHFAYLTHFSHLFPQRLQYQLQIYLDYNPDAEEQFFFGGKLESSLGVVKSLDRARNMTERVIVGCKSHIPKGIMSNIFS